MLARLIRRVTESLRLSRGRRRDKVEAAAKRWRRADEAAMDRRAKVHFWEIYRFRRWR